MAMLRRASSLLPILRPFRSLATSASVYDVVVDITVLDKDGHRHALRGRVGQTLAEVLSQHTDVLGDDGEFCVSLSLSFLISSPCSSFRCPFLSC